mgnify:CR=1 FL=1
MAKLFDGKVAFITGAARGQGRAHAVRFAEEGADIIAFDLCGPMDEVGYALASPEDLDETVNLVEKTGRRIIAEHGDVRDFARLQQVVARGEDEFGRIDFVLANAGILTAIGAHRDEMSSYTAAIDVMLNGVYYTIQAAVPALLRHGDGGAIVITSSAAGFKSHSESLQTMSPGNAGYIAAKHGVVGVMRYFATSLAQSNIRVNSVHPGGVATPMIFNSASAEYFQELGGFGDGQKPMLPIPPIEPEAVTDAMVYLCGPSGKYLTGVTLPVDGGLTLR